MKILNGRELAGFIKERQFGEVAAMARKPKLLIIRDSDDPVITKYVGLKQKYGADIGVLVEDTLVETGKIAERILAANKDDTVCGVIVQLPLMTDKETTEEIVSKIAPEKDVDGLANGEYESATATAINWLFSGYDVNLKDARIAIVGRGKLVGAPLYKMYTESGYTIELFHHGSDLTKLKDFDIIITATGKPGLITSSMVKPGAVVVDAGTASEKGVLKGDVSQEVRERKDLAAITPVVGGVGPLTVCCLFEHVILAAKKLG